MTVFFREPGSTLPSETPDIRAARHFERLDRYGSGSTGSSRRCRGAARLPADAARRRGAGASTLHVEVTIPGGGTDAWDEVESLVHSDDSAEQGDHFMVETDERRRSTLRFGNGTNGTLLPQGAVVRAQYQIGGGAGGNVGADQILFASPLTTGGTLTGAVVRSGIRSTSATAAIPETAEKIRNAPREAFRARQLRAVTLADYVRRAEEVPAFRAPSPATPGPAAGARCA